MTEKNTALIKVKGGEKVRIKTIAGGRGLRQRLSDLGLYEGATIKVVKNNNSGPIVLKVLDSRLLLGRGQAQKIIVEIL